MYERVCIVAAMDKSAISFGLCTIRTSRPAISDRLHRARWLKTKRSTPADWRDICVSIVAIVNLAHFAAYATLYQTYSAETHHTHSVDGAYLLWQCGNFIIFNRSTLCIYIISAAKLHLAGCNNAM